MMRDKGSIADLLEEVGLLLELKGENPFKVRAYANGARTLRGVAEDLGVLVEEKRLGQIKGIGAGLADAITQLATTGEYALYAELKASVPAGLLEMVKIPSLGPKKVKTIHEQLGLSTVGELEYACKENRLASLAGFGEKSQAKILEGIEVLRRFAGQFLFPEASHAAQALEKQLAALPAVVAVSIAGSLRRRKEVVRDVDLLCATTDAQVVMAAFVSLPGIHSVIGQGPTKTSVRLDTGLQVDLRAVTPAQFPFALLYFTGSKEHNTAMRGRAKQRGLHLNEYALAREDGTEIPCATEDEIFRALDLAPIAPELREDQGEIEAAAAGTLPHLVEADHIRGVFHAHTTHSDGTASVEAMARAAQALGYTYLGLSDHSQTASYARGLTADRVKAQLDEIDEVNSVLDGFRIFKGIESDILPDGRLDYPDDVLARFDFVIGSVHASLNLPAEEQTRRLLKAMENPYLTMIGHLTGRLLLARQGFGLDMDAIITEAARRRVIIEVNANPHRLDVDWRHLKTIRDRGVMVSINPDAHTTEGLADTIYGVGIARKGWIEPKNVLNTRSAQEVVTFLADQRRFKGLPA